MEKYRTQVGRDGAASVLGVDPSPKMLAIGRVKVALAALSTRVELRDGDATSLADLEDASFDKISMSFGIRNVPEFALVLREMRRVAASNATLAILEFCEPETGPLAPLARLFIRHVVPRLGALVSGAKWSEYQHLQRSIAAFPPPTAFAQHVRDAGFEVEPVRFLGFGAVALYVAKPRTE